MSDYAIVLAARLSSQRLPRKALAELWPGVTVLGQLIARWQQSDRAPTLILTTTDQPDDDPIAELGRAAGIPVSRGDARNVVAQMDLAVRRYAPDARFVARALADNPLVDVGLADWRLDVLAETGADGLWWGGDEARITYAGTTDVWSRDAWNTIARESSGSQLEHPGVYYWDHLGKFNVVQLPLPRREYLANVRTELDTLRDLELFQAVCAGWLEHGGMDFVEEGTTKDMVYGKMTWKHRDTLPPTLWALKWLADHPLVAAINAGVPVKTQSRARFPNHFKPWLCDHCQDRMGSLVQGNLRVHCPGCGQPRTFYSQKPGRKYDMGGFVP